MANVNKIAKFLKDSVEELIKIDEGCCELKLDDDLSLFVGWSGGYDNQPDDTIIQSKNDPEYAINAGIKSNHEYLKTDFDWLNYPYEEESGEVWDSGITISPNEDYEKDAQWFVDQYAEIRTALDKGEIVLESKKVENVYKSEDITFQEIEARMDNAEDYADLYEAASLIADTGLRIDVENLIGQCEDDEDTIDQAVSIICSDLLDAYANEENVEHFEESKKVGEKKLQEDWAEDVDFVADYVLANVDGKDNVEFEDLRNIIHDGLKEFYPEMSEEELEDKESDIEPDIRTILSLNGYGTDFVTGNVTTDIDSLEEGKLEEDANTLDNSDEEDLATYLYSNIMETASFEKDGSIVDDYEFEDLEEVQDWYDSSVTEEMYNKVKAIVDRVLKNTKYYNNSETAGVDISIELNDNHTLNDIQVPEGYKDDGSFYEVSYAQLVNDAAKEFEERTGVPLEYLGRSGRHVCVANNFLNAYRYNELKAVQEELEQKVINDANAMLNETEPVEEGKKIEEKDTKQEYQDYCKDSGIDANKKSSINKFLNDYAKNYTKMNGISNLQSEIDRVKKELRESISKKVEGKEEYTLDNIDDAIHEVRSKIAKQRAYDRRRDAVCLSIGDDDAVYKPMYDELKRLNAIKKELQAKK